LNIIVFKSFGTELSISTADYVNYLKKAIFVYTFQS